MTNHLSKFDLSGKVAIVTGGGTGIGHGIALGLASCGATIAIAGRRRDKVDAAAADIVQQGGKAIARICDVADLNSVVDLIAGVAGELGGIDIVVNSAGVNARVPGPEEITPECWDLILATNLTGTHYVSTTVLPEFKKRGRGKIINISSMMGIFGGKTIAAYAASKGGVEQYTKSCAIAWAAHNVQVNCIEPGWIETDMTRASRSDPSKSGHIIDRTPAARYGLPDDLAWPAVFLASAASDFITGISLPVDGGFAIQGTARSVDI